MPYASALDPKPVGVIGIEHRKKSPGETEKRIAAWIDLFFYRAKQSERRVEKKNAEEINHPVEPGQEGSTDQNQRGAHNKRPDHAPLQDTWLQGSRDAEIPENYQENEKIVDRQRLLDDVPGEKLNRFLPSQGSFT